MIEFITPLKKGDELPRYISISIPKWQLDIEKILNESDVNDILIKYKRDGSNGLWVGYEVVDENELW